jgi:hypothetical protein
MASAEKSDGPKHIFEGPFEILELTLRHCHPRDVLTAAQVNSLTRHRVIIYLVGWGTWVWMHVTIDEYLEWKMWEEQEKLVCKQLILM